MSACAVRMFRALLKMILYVGVCVNDAKVKTEHITR